MINRVKQCAAYAIIRKHRFIPAVPGMRQAPGGPTRALRSKRTGRRKIRASHWRVLALRSFLRPVLRKTYSIFPPARGFCAGELRRRADAPLAAVSFQIDPSRNAQQHGIASHRLCEVVCCQMLCWSVSFISFVFAAAADLRHRRSFIVLKEAEGALRPHSCHPP